MKFFVLEATETRINDLLKLLTVKSSGNNFNISRTPLQAKKAFNIANGEYDFLILDTTEFFQFEREDLLDFIRSIPEVDYSAGRTDWPEAFIIGDDRDFINNIIKILEEKLYLTNWKDWNVELFEIFERVLQENEFNRINARLNAS